jgi:Mlc titration factor MtfA (ptsG expression regulator)
MLDALINLLRKLAKFAGNPQSSEPVVIREDLPGSWLPWVESLPFYSTLTEAEKKRLLSYTCTLVENKRWRGLDGFEVTDEVKVTIAAQAALPLLGIEHHFYRGVDEILIHPSTYKVSSRKRGPGGVVIEGKTEVLGTAHSDINIVTLSWQSARHGGANWQDGRNVVIHEFAHKLDMLDDFVDGTPPLSCKKQHAAWVRIMTKEYEQLVDMDRRGKKTVLSKYGATNPAEFFAVSTETFFEKPRQMRKKRPELYEQLKTYFNQDPAARLDR